MTWRPEYAVFLAPVVVIAIVLVGFFALANVRSGGAEAPTAGLTATAALQSPEGASVGTVTFRQAASGVLVMADTVPCGNASGKPEAARPEACFADFALNNGCCSMAVCFGGSPELSYTEQQCG